MRCSCCDKSMTDKEIQWNKEYNEWEVCSVCLEIALDAAYSDGFQNDDDDNVILVGEESDDDRVGFISYSDYRPLGHTLVGDD